MLDWKRCLLGLMVAASLGCGDSNDDSDDDALDGGADSGAADSGGSLEGGIDAGTADAGHMDAGLKFFDAGSYDDDDGGACSGLQAVIRDFTFMHPDFQKYSGNDPTKGLVQTNLGPDNKPVFASSGNPTQITSAATFMQWYNDVPGVNIPIGITIPLTPVGNGSYQYASNAFFPIDNMGFGNEGNDNNGVIHNFSFTTEVHTSFTYRGGEQFTFNGDDDLWIFVNRKLALDLGGLHPPRSGTIDFDAQAAQLGIVKGSSYKMDIFHAERHTTQSNFTVRTTIDCFVPVFGI